MHRSYSLLAAIAVLIGLILLLTTVGSLAQLYAAVAVVSPLLAQLVLGIVLLALLAALAVLARYSWLFLRPKRRRKIVLPTELDAVATISLQAARQQVEQVEDEISRQALAARSDELAQRLAQRTFQIVVFGLGSTGKTALVNALMGEIAGEVAATIGTTQAGTSYRIAIPAESAGNQLGNKKDRELLLVDTPGLLEFGEQGEARANEAKRLAAKADLLLFVVDNDLHRAEYEPLEMLMRMGKRSLLVLNKSDRYLPTEKEQILQRLHERTHGLLNSEDVVAIAANPSSLVLDDGSQVQVEPDVAALISRIFDIWNTESTDLIATNLLLQSQKISEEAQALLDTQRQQQAQKIVERYQWVGAGVLAATPLPVIDMLATAAVNAQMVIEIGRVYGIDISIEESKTLALSLAKTMAGLSLTKGAMKLLAVGLQANLATAVASKLLQGVSAAYLTHIAGKSFITYFRANQDWGDGGVQAVVEQQYQLNRKEEFVKQFLSNAIERLT
ncbi:GTPase, putative [Synechococcus sp. PCC 7335]|uniref:GTP-binding protein n=1 Tax=Synechococcus sp. (strain ATCC 29403 / PCC 7335) TaxID=91464 RepID=UPI00017EE780|nr:GTP-binding protein [Synechococcus sp. PCC 7335]EDX86282.1 GTPase, putative [Synechococcus sp. PCC 7335]